MPVVQVDDTDHFNMMVLDNEIVVALFSTPWCPPCKRIKPFFASSSDTPSLSKVLFLQVDCSIHEDLMKKENVTSFPTFNFYVKGKYVDRYSSTKEETLLSMIESFSRHASD